MSKDIKEFPDLSNKLAAPSKKSVFERQKAEAEAKKAREEAETAAVYKDFVASFENEDEDDDMLSRMGGGGGRTFSGTRGGSAGAGGGPKRHFAPSGPRAMNSGPGSLGPPPSKRRAFESSFQPSSRDQKGTLGHSDRLSDERRMDTASAFQHSDEEDAKARDDKAEERAAPKPTMQLTQLPPGTSPAVIKALLPASLAVDNVRVLPSGGSGSTERRAMAAIVTLAKDTPASDIDTAVSGLQNRYLGYGFYLNISRHLSSAALGGSLAGGSLTSSSTALPFGAKAPPVALNHPLNRGPPPGMRGQFAPPTSYAPSPANRGLGAAQVEIRPPSDIRELKLIHKTVESLLIHGPEFEALLMSRREVQQDERWAWLWDPRSRGGVWYRWRLWQVLTGSGIDNRRRADAPNRLFDTGATWHTTDRDDSLKFEWATAFDELVSNDDYGSSDSDDSDDEGRRRRQQQHERTSGPPDASVALQEPEKGYLNPLQKAKLTHLLARLPTTTARLRKGDVARVTAFAISHAGAGADEVVEMIVSNVERPFCWSGAAHSERAAAQDGFENEDAAPAIGPPADGSNSNNRRGEEQDQTSAKLIALYLISDILSSSSTSGVRHAWKYRQLFEKALRRRDVFAKLGRLEKDQRWGRLRAEKWRRSVEVVLRLWEGWSAFQHEVQAYFAEAFSNPPLTAEEERKAKAEAQAAREKGQETVRASASSRWRSVEDDGAATTPAATEQDDQTMQDSTGVEGLLPAEEDSDGDPASDEELDGEIMADSDAEQDTPASTNKDIDVPMVDVGSSPVAPVPAPSSSGNASGGVDPPVRSRRQRPRAVDMFADSDGE